MPRRKCQFCDAPLPRDARSNQKFCDADCRRGRPKLRVVTDGEREPGAVVAAVEEAIAKAHEEKRIGVLDAPAVAAIRVLARKIDEEQDRWNYCLEWAELHAGEGGAPPKPPAMDNVSIPTFLRYCESLGLTPAGRGRIPGGTSKEGGGGSKLDRHTAAVRKPKR